MSCRVLLAIVIFMVLGGCDGRIGFSDAASAVENSSGRELVRGLAFRLETKNEDPDKSENRRDFIESVAERQGLNLSDDLGEILRGNKLYQNIVFREIGAEKRALPVAFIEVQFEVDGGYSVELQFMLEQAEMLGFVHLSKLPTFMSGNFKHGENVLPIMTEKMFELVLSKNQNALKEHFDEIKMAFDARQAAELAKLQQEAADIKKSDCERQAYNRGNDLEVDPNLSYDEKIIEIKKFEEEQQDQINRCLER